jgi:hypothetical protein
MNQDSESHSLVKGSFERAVDVERCTLEDVFSGVFDQNRLWKWVAKKRTTRFWRMRSQDILRLRQRLDSILVHAHVRKDP